MRMAEHFARLTLGPTIPRSSKICFAGRSKTTKNMAGIDRPQTDHRLSHSAPGGGGCSGREQEQGQATRPLEGARGVDSKLGGQAGQVAALVAQGVPWLR